MAKISIKGNPFTTIGEIPEVGTMAPDFSFVKKDLSEMKLSKIKGKFKVLNIFPSIDTGVCALSVKAFNKEAASLNETTVINISKDLPFAQGRFCGAEGINKVEVGSVFNSDFAKSYGLEIADGPLKGLCSRVVMILDEENKIIYTEQVSEITQEPNYENALKWVRGEVKSFGLDHSR